MAQIVLHVCMLLITSELERRDKLVLLSLSLDIYIYILDVAQIALFREKTGYATPL